MLRLKKSTPTRAESQSKYIAEINGAVSRASDVFDPRSLAERLETLAQNLRLKWATTSSVL